MVAARKYSSRKRYSRKSKKGYVEKLIHRNIEDKHVSYSLVTHAGTITDTWIELNISDIAQGYTGITRVGRKINLTALEIKGVIGSGSDELATDDPYNVVRMMVALWYGGGGTTPLGTAGVTLNQPVTKDQNSRNFLMRKYVDKYIPLEVTSTEKGAGDGYTPQLKTVRYYKRFKKPIGIQFGDDNAIYPDKRLMISFLSDSTAATSPGFVAGYWMLHFEDA